MKRALLAVFAAASLCAAPTMKLVDIAVSDVEGGPPNPADYQYKPGQVIYFTCRASGYSQDKDQQVKLSYSVQGLDSSGVPLAEAAKNDLNAEVTPQDKEWLPKIEASVALPGLLFTGAYKIVIKVDDHVAKTSTDLTVPFNVRSVDDVQPAQSLTLSAFRFLRNEEDTHAAERAAYRPGDHLWAKFAVVGFKAGADKKLDVSYVYSILGPDGKTLWSHEEPAGDVEPAFYPQPYIQAEFGLEIQPRIKPAQYQLMVQAKDAIGNQTAETKQTFTIE